MLRSQHKNSEELAISSSNPQDLTPKPTLLLQPAYSIQKGTESSLNTPRSKRDMSTIKATKPNVFMIKKCVTGFMQSHRTFFIGCEMYPLTVLLMKIKFRRT